MGEIADQIINGETCDLCCSFFRIPHGYPVTCSDCWRDLSKKDGKIHQKALKENE